MDFNIEEIVMIAAGRLASDIHIVCGMPICFRIDGRIVEYNDYVLTANDCERIGRGLAGERIKRLKEQGEIDMAISFGEGVRCRLNLFLQQGCISVAIRILGKTIPELDKIGVPECVKDFVNLRSGIVIITGETGSGKSTTLASLLDRVNHTQRKHIVTLEEPIEYVYTRDKCIINQRSVGLDTTSFMSGLSAALREDPDIILVGEMRDLETIETALTAAETGHLVFATLHTNSAADSIERIVNVFPGEKQEQIKMQLASSLRAVVSQQLLIRNGGKGRILACEVMIVNHAIKNLIRDGKLQQIENAIVTSGSDGNIILDKWLLKMVADKSISKETAVEASRDPENMRRQLGLINPNKAGGRRLL